MCVCGEQNIVILNVMLIYIYIRNTCMHICIYICVCIIIHINATYNVFRVLDYFKKNKSKK